MTEQTFGGFYLCKKCGLPIKTGEPKHNHSDQDLPGRTLIGSMYVKNEALAAWLKQAGYVKLDEDQTLPDMVFYCKTCDKMVKNTRCNIVDSRWRKIK